MPSIAVDVPKKSAVKRFPLTVSPARLMSGKSVAKLSWRIAKPLLNTKMAEKTQSTSSVIECAMKIASASSALSVMPMRLRTAKKKSSPIVAGTIGRPGICDAK